MRIASRLYDPSRDTSIVSSPAAATTRSVRDWRSAIRTSRSPGSLSRRVVTVPFTDAGALAELEPGAGRTVERERRSLVGSRFVDPVGAPSVPAEAARGFALDALDGRGLLVVTIPAARVHLS